MRLLLCLLLTLSCCASLQAQAKDSHYFANQLKQKKGAERIIYLHYIMGNEMDLVENKKQLLDFIQILKTNPWDDKALRPHIDFYLKTYPCIIEKELNKRIELLNDQLENFEKGSRFYANIKHQIGMNFFVHNDYAEALENIMLANNYFEAIGWANIPEAGMYLHDIALVYFTFEEYEKVIELMRKSIFIPAFSPNLDIQKYNNIATAFDQLQQPDSALKYFKKTLEKAHFYQDTFWIVHASLNIDAQNNLINPDQQHETNFAELYNLLANKRGSLYNISQEYDNLFWNLKLKELHALVKANNLPAGRLIVQQLHRLQQHYNFSLFRTKQMSEKFRLNLFEGLKSYYTASKDYENALRYSDSVRAAQASIAVYEKSNALHISNERLSRMQHEMQLAGLQSSRKINLSLIVLLSLALILIVLFYLFMRNKKEQEKAVMLLQSQALQHKLSNSQRELNDYVERIVDKNGIIEKITEEIELLKARQGDESGSLQESIEALRNFKILTYDDWRDFQQQFETVNPELHRKLYNMEPKLTDGEVRYLMLSSLNMNNKDIAASLGISADSLRVTWSRLKKKFVHLNLENNKQLLQQITES